jgi:Fur family ferric uptake transcriptional regulator
MVAPLTQFEQRLVSNGYSITKPRVIVFELLQQKEPQTMQQLSQLTADRLNRASLYRIIALFERLSIVQRLQIGWKYRIELSNTFQEHHHHLTCSQCGKILPLPEDAALEARLALLAEQANFTVIDHQIEIRGLCPGCQTKKIREVHSRI